MSQTRTSSMIEAVANTVAGFWISVAVVAWVFPLVGVHMSFNENLYATGIMTVVSVARSYVFRRLFNWLQWRGA
jgi:hypothetical protein